MLDGYKQFLQSYLYCEYTFEPYIKEDSYHKISQIMEIYKKVCDEEFDNKKIISKSDVKDKFLLTYAVNRQYATKRF